jgi:heat-inducible transcriptional repressor
LRGASTITQQLAKNLYLSPSRSPLRKLREFLIARRLEAFLSKERILELISRELDRKVDILIGSEMKYEGMNDCSLVISSYKKKNSNLSGRIAVLGPTRMDYERVVSTLEYFSELMNKIL